jgi:hypothetical protein
LGGLLKLPEWRIVPSLWGGVSVGRSDILGQAGEVSPSLSRVPNRVAPPRLKTLNFRLRTLDLGLRHCLPVLFVCR